MNEVERWEGRAAVPVNSLSRYTPGTEVWTGPLMELRARLRDESRDGRVAPGADLLEDFRGLPRGWAAIRVRVIDRPERATWWAGRLSKWAAGLTGAITALCGLGWWVGTTWWGQALGVVLLVTGVSSLFRRSGRGAQGTLVEVLVRVWVK